MKAEVVAGARTRELRRAVMRPNQSIGDPLPGDEITDAVHFAAFDEDGEAISTCFISIVMCPWRPADEAAWQLRQMATAAQHRGQGAGAAVLACVVAHIAEHGRGILWCYAREEAVPFYQRQGLSGHGEIFTDAHHVIPHLRMWRNI